METKEILKQIKFIDETGVVPDIMVAVKSKMNIMLRGPTGTGKSFLLKELAKANKKTLLVSNMTCGTGIEEIKGRYVVVPNEDTGKPEVKWVDGILISAMKKGYWMLIEEANFMPEEVASAFYSVMDDRRNIIIEEHENEVVESHPDFRLFLTANWGYKGTIIPNDAIRNRIDTYFDLTYLTQAQEAKLITRDTALPIDISNTITKFAHRQRKIKSRNQPDISTRVLIRWATLIQNGMKPLIAGERTIVPLLFYDELEKEKLRETLKFEFEKFDYVPKAKTTGKKSKLKEKDKAEGWSGKSEYKYSATTINVGDIVSISKEGRTFYGQVSRVIETKKGTKAWAIWNEDIKKAKKKIASPYIPMESPDFTSRMKLIEKAK